MGLVDALAAYTIVTAAALGAMRRGKIVSVHPENIKNHNAKMAFEKFVQLGDIIAEKGGKLLKGVRQSLKGQ